MICKDREPDLLLLGLGEISLWRRWQTAGHLRRCARCRVRQAELATVSRGIASALRPPAGNGGGGSGFPAASRPALLPGLASSPLFLALVLGLLTLSAVTVWYVRSHAATARSLQDDGCLPGLPSDRCR